MTAPHLDDASIDEQPTRSARPAFGAVFFFCLGALVAKLVAGALPPLFEDLFSLLVYAGIALGFALAYRRFVRRTMEERRRARARRASSEREA